MISHRSSLDVHMVFRLICQTYTCIAHLHIGLIRWGDNNGRLNISHCSAVCLPNISFTFPAIIGMTLSLYFYNPALIFCPSQAFVSTSVKVWPQNLSAAEITHQFCLIYDERVCSVYAVTVSVKTFTVKKLPKIIFSQGVINFLLTCFLSVFQNFYECSCLHNISLADTVCEVCFPITHLLGRNVGQIFWNKNAFPVR